MALRGACTPRKIITPELPFTTAVNNSRTILK